jgi:hypothetical protein
MPTSDDRRRKTDKEEGRHRPGPPPWPPHTDEMPHQASAPAAADLGGGASSEAAPQTRPELGLRPCPHAAAAGEQPHHHLDPSPPTRPTQTRPPTPPRDGQPPRGPGIPDHLWQQGGRHRRGGGQRRQRPGWSAREDPGGANFWSPLAPPGGTTRGEGTNPFFLLWPGSLEGNFLIQQLVIIYLVLIVYGGNIILCTFCLIRVCITF